MAEKERPGLPEDSGSFSYCYDALNRLTTVAQNGQTLRTYSYDAFGNRSSKTEYQTAGGLVTTYRYNTRNQLLQETNANGTKDYAYDHRGNLLSVTSGEEVLRAYGFDAANQMNSSMGMTDGQIKKAVYQYNGLGHRMEQSIAAGDAAPEQTIRYTLDVTRQYHNLLQKTENNVEQTYFWDGNVTGMEEEGREHFYFQDDLGSPMRLADEAGRSEETYGFDEFGNDIRTAKDIFKDSLQSFGFTGYQMDSAGGLYFAQARRYDAGVGRFVSEDFIKGHIAVPYTMNHYNYCWNRPMDMVDLNGMWPKWVETTVKVVTVIAAVATVGAVVVGTGGVATVIVAGALTTGVISGFVNEELSGSYINGFAGGVLAGTIQAVTSLTGPVGNIIGGAANGLGSAVTDTLDNLDPWSNKKKSVEQIERDAVTSSAKGMVFSLPGGFMQWATGPGNTTAQALMRGYNTNSTNVYGLFYGLIDNGLLAADSIGNMFTNLPTHIKEQISDMKKDEEKE